jgi:hypothetical protein
MDMSKMKEWIKNLINILNSKAVFNSKLYNYEQYNAQRNAYVWLLFYGNALVLVGFDSACCTINYSSH